MKIVFMGTPDFAKESLEAIYNAGHEILAVVTNPDKPNGRGMKMQFSPVKEFATLNKIKIFQPLKIRNNIEFIDEIKRIQPELLCVVAYGKILPKELLEIPKYGAINVHGSLLPKYRGAAPIQWAVLNGDKETGITTMFMDEGMDTGDMILQEKVSIGEDETLGSLWDRLSKTGAKLLVKTIDNIANASKKIETNGSNNCVKEIKSYTNAKKQGEAFTLAPMLNKEMAKIDWNKSNSEIKNLVRGLNPIMGAYTFYENKKIKLWKVENISVNELEQRMKINIAKDYENQKNGTILVSDRKQGLFIKTKNGITSITELQGDNGKKMNIKDFLNGNSFETGKILG